MPTFVDESDTGHDGHVDMGEDAFGNTVSLRWEEEGNCVFIYVNGQVEAVRGPTDFRQLAGLDANEAAALAREED